MKSLLLPLSAQAKAKNAMHIAAQFALQFRASLNALYIRPDPRSAIPYMGEGLTADMIQELCNAADQDGTHQAKETQELYADTMADAGLEIAATEEKPCQGSRATWHEKTGAITDHVGRRARTADLAICSKPSLDSGDSQEIFHDLIYRSGRPVLMIPEECKQVPGGHIMVAWNGRAEGARAVGASLPILWSADKVSLLQIGQPKGDRPGLDNVADYLRDHGVSCTLINPQSDGSPIGGQILDIAKQEAADMIVVGAYSHSRWREMILGGVTRHLVTYSELPIFMSH
jgi:nucleotide-binding universal stress UspA family protein